MSPSPKAPVGVSFKVHIIGSVTGKAWPGEFYAKPTLSFRDKLNADRLRRELIGPEGGMVDSESAVYAMAISQLSVRLTSAPEWWKESKGGLDLEDPNILLEVYKAAIKVENDHQAAIEAEGKAAQTELRKE